MAKTLAQIKAKHEHEYQNEDGKTVTSQTFIKNFTIFEDIEYLYSTLCPAGIKIDSFHVALYCRFMSYQANGGNCYESHATLARKHKTSVSTIGRRISELKKLGLVTTEPNPDPRYDTLLYTALPLTDAHITPPEAPTAQPVVVSDEMPAPEPVKAAEEEMDDDVPDWFHSKDEVKPTPTLPTQQDKPELPWGGRKGFETNGYPAEEGVQWALTETMGDEEKAYQLISRVLSEYFGRTEVFTPRSPEVYDDCDPIPF